METHQGSQGCGQEGHNLQTLPGPQNQPECYMSLLNTWTCHWPDLPLIGERGSIYGRWNAKKPGKMEEKMLESLLHGPLVPRDFIKDVSRRHWVKLDSKPKGEITRLSYKKSMIRTSSYKIYIFFFAFCLLFCKANSLLTCFFIDFWGSNQCCHTNTQTHNNTIIMLKTRQLTSMNTINTEVVLAIPITAGRTFSCSPKKRPSSLCASHNNEWACYKVPCNQ